LQVSLSGTGIKVYWVDDFSESIPSDFMKAVNTEPNFNLIRRQSGKAGKKEAIAFGMDQINTEWVLLMDADTTPHPAVFSSGSFPANRRWKMVLLPLLPVSSRKLIPVFFDLEFLVLQLVTHASAMLGYPLLANGAALLVRRLDYLESLEVRNDFHIASGDDIFALFAFQSKFGRESIGSAAYGI
jgi:hypothetical protein